MKKTLSIFIGLVAFVPAATSQVTLEIKHHENSTFKTRHIHKASNTTRVAGQKSGGKHSAVMIRESVTGARAADGTLRAKTTVKTLTFKFEGDGNVLVDFDSADPNRKAPVVQLEPFNEMLRIMLKHPVIEVFNKDGTVKTVEFPDDAGRDLPEPFNKMLKSASVNAFVDLKQQQEMLPDKAISKGDTWTRNQKVDFGGLREMSLRIDFQYEGTAKKDGRELDRISGKITDVAYVGEDWREGPGLVKNAELKPAKSSVEVLFDRKLGRYVEMKMLVQVKGELTLEADGNELPAKWENSFEQGMKVLPQEK
jgi:hypothetical protein